MREHGSPVGGRGSALGGLAIFALTFGYCALFVHYGWNDGDEGVLLAQYYRTYAGELPVRDFHIGYTPGDYYFNAGLFRLFGPSVTSLRWALAVCHALAALGLFAIGRRLMPPAFALLPPLVYCAILPFSPGEFALFNIAYPAWYGVLFMVAGLWVLLRFTETAGLGWMVAAGLLTGICFSFKPNVGLFQLAMNGLVLLVVLEPPARRGAAVWWLLLGGVVAGLAIVFAAQAGVRDVVVFLLPVLVVAGCLVVRRLRVDVAETPPHSLLRCAVVFGVAMLVPILPWVVGFLSALGPQWFARSLLFIGAGFERFYYIAFHEAGPYDAALVLLVAATGVVATLARSGRLPPATLLAGAGVVFGVALLALGRARMPEGVQAAIVSRVEDLSYTACLIVHWVSLALAIPQLMATRRSRIGRTQLALLLGAFVMFLKLYPRSDFAHLVVAVPLTLVLGARLAARLAAAFPVAFGVRRLAVAALVAGTFIFIGARISPNLGSVLTWDGGPRWRPYAALGLERAPLHLEMGREPRVRAVRDTVAFIEANSAPGERLFTFPAIEAFCFLTDRTNATRHGYFFTGWPGHEVEAEVVAALTEAPPRLMVTLQAHQIFFFDAPAYYFALRAFVREHYREVARFGDYAVLAHRRVPDAALVHPPRAPSEAPASLARRYGAALAGDEARRRAAAAALGGERLLFMWEPAMALLRDEDPGVRAVALGSLASVADPAIVPRLLDALRTGLVPDRRRLIVIRRVLAIGDARAAGDVLGFLDATDDPREREEWLLAIKWLGVKIALRDHWFGEPRPFAVPPGPLHDVASWQARLWDPDEPEEVRTFLARVLPRIDAVAAAPLLCPLLAENETADLRSAAAEGLLRAPGPARPCDPYETILALVDEEPTFAPSLALIAHAADDREPPRLLGALEAAPDRVGLAWVAAATGDTRFRNVFVSRLRDPSREMRLAALAGLARLGDAGTVSALERVASDDDDYEVRATAARILARLGR